MRRTILALTLLTVLAFGAAVTWQEDTVFRTGTWTTVQSGRFTLGPGDTSTTLMLTYYPWTQLWAYCLMDSAGVTDDSGAIANVEWSYGSFDPYNKTNFYWADWRKALPTTWFMTAAPESMRVYDSLYLGPLIDADVPLAWVDRARFRVVCDTNSDSVSFRFWVRRRSFTEGGDVMQILPWWFFPN